MRLRKFLLLAVCCVLALAPVAGADEPVRLGVMRFLSRADGVSERQAEAIGEAFTWVLANSRTISVIERDRLEAIAAEHKLGLSGVVDANTAVKVGRLMGCQYMLLGSVTNLARKASGVNVWIVGSNKQEASATIDARVVDVETGEVVLSMSETGTSSQSGSSFNFYGVSTTEAQLSGMEGRAIRAAASSLGFRIREALTGEYAQVVSTTGKDITFNVGDASGVSKGGLYRIYTDGEEIRNVDGSLLGRKASTIAVVRVVDAHNDFSVANVVKNGGNIALIQRGDKVSPISPAESADLVKRKAFARERPRQPRVTMASLTPSPALPQRTDLPRPAQPQPQPPAQPKVSPVSNAGAKANLPMPPQPQQVQPQVQPKTAPTPNTGIKSAPPAPDRPQPQPQPEIDMPKPHQPQTRPSSGGGTKVDLLMQEPDANLLRAAEQGDAESQFKLGRMYANGDGVMKNYQRAREWYLMAANQGHAKAQNNLGVLYHDGKGVPKDYEQARKWYLKAAEQGVDNAQGNLGVLYYYGQGVKEDNKQAMEWFRKAAAQGHARSQNFLGLMYERGHGVKQSQREAVEWYRKSANQGYSTAQTNLGVMYENGRGVTKDYKQAVQWYRKAADKGNARAQCNLGWMYENGRGVSKSKSEAIAWYRKAAAQKDERAQKALKRLGQ